MTSQAGALMKQWRTDLGISQFRLALLTGMSQRHLSFIETGRSRPSRATVLAIARALALSPQQTDLFLVRAGFRPQVQPLRAAAIGAPTWHKIVGQLPEALPAAIVDEAWDVLAQTGGFDRLLLSLGLTVNAGHPLNLLTLFMSPSSACDWVHEGQSVGRSLLQHLIAAEPSYPDRSRVSEVIGELRAALDLLALRPDAGADVMPSAFELLVTPPAAPAVHLGIVSTYLDPVGSSTNASYRLLLVNRLNVVLLAS